MKSLRTMVLLLAVAAVSFSAKQAFAQREVDPVHFDQTVAAKTATTAYKPRHPIIRNLVRQELQANGERGKRTISRTPLPNWPSKFPWFSNHSEQTHAMPVGAGGAKHPTDILQKESV